MDYFTGVAVVNGCDQLYEQFVSFALRKRLCWLRLPELFQFAALQVLHHYYQLLFFGQGKIVKKLHNMSVLQGPQRLNLFSDHMLVLIALEI